MCAHCGCNAALPTGEFCRWCEDFFVESESIESELDELTAGQMSIEEAFA